MKNETEAIILFAIACQSSSVDQKSNTTSLFNIIEEIQIQRQHNADKQISTTSEITVPMPFNLVVLFARKDMTNTAHKIPLNVKIEFIDPAGRVLINAPFQGTIEKGQKKFRLTAEFGEMKLTKTGIYYFRVSLFDNEHAEKVLRVTDTPIDAVITS